MLKSNVDGSPSGLDLIVAGDVPKKQNKWDSPLGWASTSTGGYSAGTSWNRTLLLTVNDRNFPAGGLDPAQQNLPARDLEALLTGAGWGGERGVDRWDRGCALTCHVYYHRRVRVVARVPLHL